MPPGTPPAIRRAEAEDPTNTFQPGQGAVSPTDINMQVILAVVAGVAGSFVLAGIWFFFRAKNGGFVWRQGDWGEYKSTVLRRKGPDGKTLSNATKSTDLGGGSVVPQGLRSGGYTDYDEDDATRTRTRGDGGTYATTDAGMSEKQPRKKRDRFKDKFRRKKNGETETWEGQNDDDVRAYRHEKPARVGGLNRHPDGTYHEGSTEHSGTNPQMTEWSHSDLGDGAGRYDDYPEHGGGHERRRESTRQQQQRNFSFTPGEEDAVSNATEQHPLRDDDDATAPPRRQTRRQHHQTNRNSQRPRGPRPGNAQPSQPSPRNRDRRSMPGGYASPLDMSSANGSEYQYEQVGDSDTGTGTRGYHHPIPALTKGYRRDAGGRGKRRDSLSDSDDDV